jgi:hypothetical protein
VELVGALSNPEALKSWCRLKKQALRAIAEPVSFTRGRDAQLQPRKRIRRSGWVWREVRAVLEDADSPMTPNEVRTQLEDRLGEPIASSTVKDCMARHARESKELRRFKGGRYAMRRQSDHASV